MFENLESVKDILQALYDEKKISKKGAYSLRAFAHDLGVSPGRLTAFLQKTNLPSSKTISKISKNFRHVRELESKLQQAVVREKKNRLVNKADLVLRQEDFHIIVDWIPFAIISLLMIRNFELSAKSVSERLGISMDLADSSISKLKSMNLIKEENSRWIAHKRKIATEMDIPSEMIRRSHKEKMQLASAKIDEIKVDMRDYSSITFPIDPHNLPIAKKMLADFRRTLAETMGRGSPSEVYALNLQLFPLTNSENLKV